MTSPTISRFDVPEFQSLPQDIQNRMTEIQEKAGFIPNVFLALAYRPDELRAFMAYHDALILRDSGLSKAEKEMIIVAKRNTVFTSFYIVINIRAFRISPAPIHNNVIHQIGIQTTHYVGPSICRWLPA